MRYLITKCTFFLLVLLVSSCAHDELTHVSPASDEAVLSFTLPNRSNVEFGAQSKTAKNDFEKNISNMNVYIVEATEGESTPADDAAVLEHYDTYTNTDSEISVKVLSRDEPCWVVVLVNLSDDTFDPSTYEDIKNLSLGLRSLYVTPGGEYANDLPMFGQRYLANITIGSHVVDLAHVCARIDVNSVAENFKLESVTLMNGANKGHFVPQSPMEEYTGADVTQYEAVEMGSEETAFRPIYLFENSGGTSAEKNYTDIILGGKYTISTDNEVESFIKVKMEHSDPLTADIVRNTLYKLTLQSIKKSNIGYSSIEEAQAGEYSDVKIEIKVDLDAFTDLVVGNGDYYLSLSNSEYRAFIPSDRKEGLTAVTMRFNKNSTADVDMTKINKEISLGANSKGITIVGGSGDKTTTWKANEDIAVEVDLDDNASGSFIVRIGNLVKEVHIVREQNEANFATAFNDDNYVFAQFTNEAPVWLMISSKNGTPSVMNELYSEDGFKLGFSTERDGSQSAELYLSRNSEKGRTKVYVEQYKQIDTNEFNVSGLSDNTNISYVGAKLTTSFAVSGSTAALEFLDETQDSGDISWEAEFSYDGGATWTTDKPDWIDMPTSGTGTLSGSTIKAAPQQCVLSGEAVTAQNKLKAAIAKGSVEAPYNLANNGGADNVNESTANCYLVGAPGTYKLPLIYGNAKKNGSPNTKAYEGGAFVKHDGKEISKPEIDGAANAILMWQDAPGLVTDVEISGSDYLVFTVPQKTIMEGNAVLAVRNSSNTILWSWHIWVTNYTLGDYKTVQYKTGSISGSSKMMNVNLGWCSPGSLQYGAGPREVKVRVRESGGEFRPTEGGVTYKQNVGGRIESIGNSTYYQFGRKDPMLPSGGSGNVNKVQYGDLQWKLATGQKTLALAIQNPNIMYIYEGDWCSTTHNNLWSATNSSDKTIHIANNVKTVYDPSPVGYIVPPTSYFSGFTTTGSVSSSLGQFNVKGSFKNGYDFYCGLNKTGSSTIHFPTIGCRLSSTGLLDQFKVNGHIWSVSPFNTANGYRLSYSEGNVNPSNNGNRAFGRPVRSVKE